MRLAANKLEQPNPSWSRRRLEQATTGEESRPGWLDTGYSWSAQRPQGKTPGKQASTGAGQAGRWRDGYNLLECQEGLWRVRDAGGYNTPSRHQMTWAGAVVSGCGRQEVVSAGDWRRCPLDGSTKHKVQHACQVNPQPSSTLLQVETGRPAGQWKGDNKHQACQVGSSPSSIKSRLTNQLDSGTATTHAMP